MNSTHHPNVNKYLSIYVYSHFLAIILYIIIANFDLLNINEIERK